MESLLNGDSPETFRFGVMSAFVSAGPLLPAKLAPRR